MANRTTDGGTSARSASITRSASATFTVNSTYGSGSKSITNSCNVSITQAANPANSSFDAPIVNSFSYGTFAAAGATLTPNISYSQQSYYASGSAGSKITSGGSLSVTLPATSGFTLNNASTGSITAAKNSSSSTRTAKPSVVVSMNGKTSASKQCTITQSANSYLYSAWSVNITNSGSKVAAAGGYTTISASATRTYGWAPSTTDVGTQTGTIQYTLETAVT